MSALTNGSSYGQSMRGCLKQFPAAFYEKIFDFLERFDDMSDQVAITIFAAIAQELGKLEVGVQILENNHQEKSHTIRYHLIDETTLGPMYHELGVESLKDYRQPQKIRRGFNILTVASNSCYVQVYGKIPKDIYIFGRYYFRKNDGPYRIAKENPYPENGLLGVYRRNVVADIDALAHKACEHGHGPYCDDD